MKEISSFHDIKETTAPEPEGYKNIKPEGEMSPERVKDFYERLFAEPSGEQSEEIREETYAETDEDKEKRLKEIEKIVEDYSEDIKRNSEYPETIPDKPFDARNLRKLTPEETAEKREEFNDKREQLKREWEEQNGRPWPKYEHDIYSANGKLIRKAGSDYDAHHIQPLGLGGKNEASNITPLNAEVHYDKQGVHSPDSPYSKLDQQLGGID